MKGGINTPDERAEIIFAALVSAYPSDVQDVSHLLTQALADLRHLADKHGLSFAQCDGNAYQIYLAERAA